MAGELILVVDDDPLNITLLADVLSHHGYRVVSANSGEACLNYVATSVPAVILMDIHMGGMGGKTALKAIRASPMQAAVKVIALTASVMPYEIAAFQASGF